jgi:hypothetical protein
MADSLAGEDQTERRHIGGRGGAGGREESREERKKEKRRRGGEGRKGREGRDVERTRPDWTLGHAAMKRYAPWGHDGVCSPDPRVTNPRTSKTVL